MGGERDAVYYARVFEAPVETVNGSPLRCDRDKKGRCLAISSCEDTDECKSPDRPRAWSCPIYVDHPKANRSR